MDGIGIAFLLLAIGLFLGFLKYKIKPVIKGKAGELCVSALLKGLPEEKYILLNDVMLPTGKGTTQIDHVLLSVYGIFVIETKNYKGRIYGNDYSEKWTQSIYGHKSQFMNPLRQNYGHICTLMDLLHLREDNFVSIVAFSGDAVLETKTDKEVIHIGKIRKTILKYQTPVFSEEEIIRWKDAILSAKIDSTYANRLKHVKGIQENIQADKKKTDLGICPKCGGQLVDRKGKYGAFVGCSNYPKCRYTKK